MCMKMARSRPNDKMGTGSVIFWGHVVSSLIELVLSKKLFSMTDREDSNLIRFYAVDDPVRSLENLAKIPAACLGDLSTALWKTGEPFYFPENSTYPSPSSIRIIKRNIIKDLLRSSQSQRRPDNLHFFRLPSKCF